MECLDYFSFEDIFIYVLNNHAPIKTKIPRAKNLEFMTKALRKVVTARSRLKYIFFKNQNTTNWNSHKYQRICFPNVLRKTKLFL